MKIMLYKHGPVMSQVDTTWLGSLEATQGIQPFSHGEINQPGGPSAYHPAAWKSGISIETGRLTTESCFVDIYLLYYRKDLLRKAGVNEASAFESLDALPETVENLRKQELQFHLPLQPRFPHVQACPIWLAGYGIMMANLFQMRASNCS